MGSVSADASFAPATCSSLATSSSGWTNREPVGRQLQRRCAERSTERASFGSAAQLGCGWARPDDDYGTVSCELPAHALDVLEGGGFELPCHAAVLIKPDQHRSAPVDHHQLAYCRLRRVSRHAQA